MIKAGERAPEFTLPDETGSDRSLTELLSAGAIVLTLFISAAIFTASRAQNIDNKTDAANDANDVVSIHGHIFDPQGKPVAGARLTTTRRWA